MKVGKFKRDSQTKWRVVGQGRGWIFEKIFPRRWKAELALKVYLDGGRVSDYWEAARDEKDRRDTRRKDNANKRIESEIEASKKAFADKTISPDEKILVCRQPRDWRVIKVPFSALDDLHFRYESGGVGQVSSYPVLYARMWCSDIPDDAEFGHSCAHGPPPHEILVCILKNHNPSKLYRQLLAQLD